MIYLLFFFIYLFGLYFLLSGLFDYYSGYGSLHSSICAYLELHLWLVGSVTFHLIVWLGTQKVINSMYFILFFAIND
jgi:hypothetical protein